MTAIRIKPHHLIDIITELADPEVEFRPSPYGHAVHSVAEAVLADRDAALAMELGIDDICEPCKHHKGALCGDTIDTSFRPDAPESKMMWNLRIDERWCERLGITQGSEVTAREFAELVRERAGDITDIYREIPAERTRQRAEKLSAGIENFLAG